MTHHQSADSSSASWVVALTSFAFACTGFVLGALVLVPLTAAFAEAIALADSATIVLLATALFGTPIAAALWGIDVASGWVTAG